MIKVELEKKVESSLQMAEKILHDTGELMPMVDIQFTYAGNKTGNIVLGMALGDERGKRNTFLAGMGIIMAVAKRMQKIDNVDCIVMMSEGWFSMPSSAEYRLMHGKVLPPSQDPNRREMLMSCGLAEDGMCIMRSKEMFSVEVKGKRSFTLSEMPEMKKEREVKVESNVLSHFFDGYKKASANDKANEAVDKIWMLFKDMPLDEMLQRSVKVLTKEIGGLGSQYINTKNKI